MTRFIRLVRTDLCMLAGFSFYIALHPVNHLQRGRACRPSRLLGCLPSRSSYIPTKRLYEPSSYKRLQTSSPSFPALDSKGMGGVAPCLLLQY